MSEIEFTDRYQALGIPHPDPATICSGHCEGTGVVPVKGNVQMPGYTFDRLWQEEHRRSCSLRGRLRKLFSMHPLEAFERCDGWHFVVCPECGGTGRRKP